MRSITPPQVVLNAKAATGVGTGIRVAEFRHVEISVATAGMGAGDTIALKFQGSLEATEPTWGSAKSATNVWDYVQVRDLEDNSAIDGDTGISIADANDVRLFQVNIDGLQWVNIEVVTLSDTANTSVTAKLTAFAEVQ